MLLCALVLPAAWCLLLLLRAAMLWCLPAACCSQPEPLLVTCVAWSANGRYLLSGHSKPDKGHSDKTEKVKASSRIILWDVLTGKQVRAQQPRATWGCTSCQFPAVQLSGSQLQNTVGCSDRQAAVCSKRTLLSAAAPAG